MVAALSPNVVWRARAPLRLSFGGGGSEIPPYVDRHGGAVLNATIGRYAYATVSAAANAVTFVADDIGVSETLPLTAALAEAKKLPLHAAVYRRVVRDHNNGKALPLLLRTYSDAPVGSGLGASSTLTVAMTCCFGEALGLNLDEYALANLARGIERDDLGLSGGRQDHYSAAFGGFNFMEFRRDGEVIVTPLRIRPATLAELEYSLALCFTGVSRESANIIDAQRHNLENDREVESAVRQIKDIAYAMKDHLLTGRLRQFAGALHDAWMLKRKTAESVSTPDIDRVYARARANGALGGKISGAGGGGFLMLLSEPERRRDVLSCLPEANGGAFAHFESGGAFAWRVGGGA